MSLIRIDRHPARRTLQVFGLAWLVFFGTVAATSYVRTGAGVVGGVLAGWAIVVPLVGWMNLRLMRLAYLGLAYVTYPIGIVVSYGLLAAIFFLVLVPTGILLRLFRYDPLNRRFDPKVPSYWTERRADSRIEGYFRQT